MQTSLRMTIDHEEIKTWALDRGGHPAKAKNAATLEIDFPGYPDDGRFEEITWEDFFDRFEESEFAFVYQEEMDGKEIRFNKFVARERMEEENNKRKKPKKDGEEDDADELEDPDLQADEEEIITAESGIEIE